MYDKDCLTLQQSVKQQSYYDRPAPNGVDDIHCSHLKKIHKPQRLTKQYAAKSWKVLLQVFTWYG